MAGLAVSAFALKFARRASRAAKEAREAVFRRNLADDLQDATRIAGDVVNLVASGRYDVALARSVELQERAIFIQQRWNSHIQPESRTQYDVLRLQLDTIQSVLARVSRNPQGATVPTLDRLNRSCRAVRVVLVEEHAIAVRAAEGVEHEG